MRTLLLAVAVSAALVGAAPSALASAEGGDSTWITAGGRSGARANGPNSAGFGATADSRGDRSAAVRTR